MRDTERIFFLSHTTRHICILRNTTPTPTPPPLLFDLVSVLFLFSVPLPPSVPLSSARPDRRCSLSRVILFGGDSDPPLLSFTFVIVYPHTVYSHRHYSNPHPPSMHRVVTHAITMKSVPTRSYRSGQHTTYHTTADDHATTYNDATSPAPDLSLYKLSL